SYDQINNLGNGMIMGGPVFWNGPNGPEIYLWGPSGQLPSCNCPDYLKDWALQGKTFNTTPAAVATIPNSSGISNLAALSLSA
ncbi:hypothetical protein, partial [Klebsiella pneumoniae]|uniref:hypothetical protein n=1 Tax=Klebsiella pneumoniae TaxID=573 RepID=UPI003013D301